MRDPAFLKSGAGRPLTPSQKGVKVFEREKADLTWQLLTKGVKRITRNYLNDVLKALSDSLLRLDLYGMYKTSRIAIVFWWDSQNSWEETESKSKEKGEKGRGSLLLFWWWEQSLRGYTEILKKALKLMKNARIVSFLDWIIRDFLRKLWKASWTEERETAWRIPARSYLSTSRAVYPALSTMRLQLGRKWLPVDRGRSKRESRGIWLGAGWGNKMTGSHVTWDAASPE